MAPHELVAAEVRAELARQQLSGVRAAKALGWTQNYLSVRLRGAVAFDVTDLIMIADLLEIPVTTFFETPGGRVISPRIETPATGSAAAA
jgi:transcriptional regulator with XRE-family HTH domain